MAKRRSPNQLPLEKRDIPKMPDGYYSSGPNPNLRRFVEEQATPYDPANDNYDVPPFDHPITTTKATAIYNMHTYWSKKPHDAIRQYIKHYTQPGDLILDPFSGSGGTALAALMDGRNAIAIDLSPAATFITKNYCTPVDTNELQQAFEALKSKIQPDMDWLYETRCDRCDGRAMTSYTLFSQVFRCERCLNEVTLFDCVELEARTQDGKPKTVNACPNCYRDGHVEVISARSNEKLGMIPVLVSYECLEGCKPKRDERRHNDLDEKKRDYFNRFDLVKLQEVSREKSKTKYWYPTARMMNVSEDQQQWGLLWRPYHKGINFVSDFYTDRNLLALASLLEAISKTPNSEPLQFAFTSILLKCSKMMAHNSDGIGRIQKGTLFVPSIIHDVNVWKFFTEAVSDMIAGYSNLAIASNKLLISTDNARDLKLPSESMDYIFTDPPYSWKVQFGESNFIWEAWMKFDTSWLQDEIIVNDFRGKEEDNWQQDMLRVMKECYRVLKPGRWLSVCYHDTSEGTWQLLQDLMTEAGFIPDMLTDAIYIDAAQKSIKQITAHQVAKRDLVINFRKPRPDEIVGVILTGDEDERTFTEKAQAILGDALHKHPGSTPDRLYDELVSRMVRRGEFERHNFDHLLRGIAEESNGRWYLLETADQIDDAESSKENAAAARLEAFMRKVVDPKQGITGAHYSDLFEQYLPVKDKPRRELRDWLVEYFYETGEGTWRLPNDNEEIESKKKLRQSGLLRRVKRFANALIEGVPPAQRDQPESVATAAEWLRQCRRAGLYDQGRAIWEKGGFNWNSLPEIQYIEVEEDYQRCVRISRL